MKLVIAVTGASGVHLGLRIKKYLPEGIESFFILTDNAKTVFEKEYVSEGNVFLDEDIAAPMASGSFGADAMIVAPCSMNTLAKISVGIADNLTCRAAGVMIKEQKKLLLAPREMPLSPIALENMLKLARLNVIISPPVMAYYSGVESVQDMEQFVIGKWLDSLGIKNDIYKRWGSE